MKKIRILLLGCLVLAVLAGGGYIAWQRMHPRAAASQLTLYGNVDIREVQLAFKESNRIAAMPVTEGTRVRKGQVLATLDRRTYEINRALARAQLQQRQAQLDALLAGTRKEDIDQLRARLNAAQASLKSARLTYRRISRLQKRNFSSRQQLDQSEAQMKVAEGTVNADRAALALAITGPRKEDIAAARAAVAAARAQLDLAQQHLDETQLVAPASGIIRNRILEPGDMASPQTPVYTLAITQPLWVRAYVDEPELGKIRPGMRAYVTTDSFPGQRFDGWVGYISPTAEFTPKQVETPALRSELVYQVRVYVCNPENRLALGMPATVTVALDQSGNGQPQQCAGSGHGG